MDDKVEKRYVTGGNIEVCRHAYAMPIPGCVEPIIDMLDSHLGVLLSSSYEYPGRYSRWDVGFVDPPVRITSRNRHLNISALNERGNVILQSIASALLTVPAIELYKISPGSIDIIIRTPVQHFTEEQRSRQWSVFSVLRRLIDLFFSPEDPYLGFYGAFGYDLAFQFDNIEYALSRPPDQRDLVLFLPDELLVVDHRREEAFLYRYEFRTGSEGTEGLPRAGESSAYKGRSHVMTDRDHKPGEFAELVKIAQDSFRRGDLFEVVPSQVFYRPSLQPPSAIYRRLKEINPAPYGALMNLGENEYLVGASPEMFLRSEGRRIETCPISGTIARGDDAISDAEQVLKLLKSEKDRSELTMCTDVDRNDKSRICEPGSIRVIGRRQIELYSRVIHTVDHVEGMLRQEFDAIDAFLSHAWAVTVTGAPKLWAMRFIEQHERSSRHWYGGAIGVLGFDRHINTGLTLRTMRIKEGIAEVRAGATLLIDSDPQSEEYETELKASALLQAITGQKQKLASIPATEVSSRQHTKVLLVDHEDSFVNTLADYFRQAGSEVVTLRSTPSPEALRKEILYSGAKLVCLSAGPGSPADFSMTGTIDAILKLNLPIFGVCLGLQGIVEYLGGQLGNLDYPMHGRASHIQVLGGRLFAGLPTNFSAGRYHSLYAIRETLPADLAITALSDDGVIMAVEHGVLPLAAVQFHPESIMSLNESVGLRLIQNVIRTLTSRSVLASAV